MYIYAGMNNLYASQARFYTNYLASQVRGYPPTCRRRQLKPPHLQVSALFEADYDLEYEYNHLLDGKWMQ
jgi:hypothetical protein